MKTTLIIFTFFFFWALLSLTTPMMMSLNYILGAPTIGFGDYGPLSKVDAYEIVMLWIICVLAIIPTPFIAIYINRCRS